MDNVTGTSAVNAKGEVIIFVDGGMLDFADFIVEGMRIILCAADGSTHDKTYGPLTLETVRRNGRIIVVQIDEHGQPGAALPLEVRRGR